MVKIKFKEFVSEYRNLPQGQPYSAHELSTMLYDENDLTLWRGHMASESKDYVIYEKSFDENEKFLIIVNRIDFQEVVGYMYISKEKKSKDLFRVMDVSIFPEFRNRGFASDLYFKAITIGGLNLINGFSMSSDVLRVWNGLKNKNLVSVWNRDEDKFYTLSEHEHDVMTDITSDDNQKWFYCASSNKKIVKENWEPNTTFGDAYEIWLRGIQPRGYAMFRFSREFIDGW